jgi:hypothetical protein
MIFALKGAHAKDAFFSGNDFHTWCPSNVPFPGSCPGLGSIASFRPPRLIELKGLVYNYIFLGHNINELA